MKKRNAFNRMRKLRNGKKVKKPAMRRNGKQQEKNVKIIIDYILKYNK